MTGGPPTGPELTGEPGPAPERVRVTGPRSGRPRRVSAASQIDAQTQIGEIYMRTLIRGQLRLALGIAAALLGTVGLLPLLFWLAPGVRHASVLGVPVPWVVLGACIYPALVLLSWLYVRRAEANEQAFADLVQPK